MLGRRLILAIQFMTRLPTPQVRDFSPADLSLSARWHPLVGAIVGAALWLPLWLLHDRPLLAAALALALWTWITGALHLDGLADVADAMGAAHRDPARFLQVLKDPHLGVFGATVLALQLLLKFALLHELARSPWLPAIVLLPAWARWGTLVWSRCLPPLQPGLGERFAWRLGPAAIGGWAVALAAASLWLAPPLLLALLVVPGIAAYWRRRLGGITGDCLGAGIEATETLLLLALALLPPGPAWIF
jgi:adenosylcobinamide-GDP ribazoletransferase